MKTIKLIAFLGILTLALMTGPAWSNNIVLNGDFENSSHLQYWTNHNLGGVVDFNTSNDAGNYFARSANYYMSGVDSRDYQIIDASTSNGWIANGIAESYDLTFQYRRNNTAIRIGYQFFYSTAATAPEFRGYADINWTLISKTSTYLPTTSGTTWATVEVTGTIDNANPRWFVVDIAGARNGSTTDFADFDNVVLSTASNVPIPPTLLLLGSGLLGLAGWRRFRKS